MAKTTAKIKTISKTVSAKTSYPAAMSMPISLPAINPVMTGKNIKKIAGSKGMSASKLADTFGFSSPSVVFKWFRGDTLPSLDNMYALSVILDKDIRDIIISL